MGGFVRPKRPAPRPEPKPEPKPIVDTKLINLMRKKKRTKIYNLNFYQCK